MGKACQRRQSRKARWQVPCDRAVGDTAFSPSPPGPHPTAPSEQMTLLQGTVCHPRRQAHPRALSLWAQGWLPDPTGPDRFYQGPQRANEGSERSVLSENGLKTGGQSCARGPTGAEGRRRPVSGNEERAMMQGVVRSSVTTSSGQGRHPRSRDALGGGLTVRSAGTGRKAGAGPCTRRRRPGPRSRAVSSPALGAFGGLEFLEQLWGHSKAE